MRTAFEYCEGNQMQTARLLGISRNIVRDRLLRYGGLNVKGPFNHVASDYTARVIRSEAFTC
jgi:hypothetical protein